MPTVSPQVIVAKIAEVVAGRFGFSAYELIGENKEAEWAKALVCYLAGEHGVNAITIGRKLGLTAREASDLGDIVPAYAIRSEASARRTRDIAHHVNLAVKDLSR
jgi:hypothetical protein